MLINHYLPFLRICFLSETKITVWEFGNRPLMAETCQKQMEDSKPCYHIQQKQNVMKQAQLQILLTLTPANTMFLAAKQTTSAKIFFLPNILLSTENNILQFCNRTQCRQVCAETQIINMFKICLIQTEKFIKMLVYAPKTGVSYLCTMHSKTVCLPQGDSNREVAKGLEGWSHQTGVFYNLYKVSGSWREARNGRSCLSPRP